MSELDGYYTGGTIHFVINNQIGFTTDFEDARSSDYCTSLAGAIHAPVFHVNGDDPEAVVKCSDIATRFRQESHSPARGLRESERLARRSRDRRRK